MKWWREEHNSYGTSSQNSYVMSTNPDHTTANSLGTDTYERSIGASLTTLPFLSLILKFIGLYGRDPATILNLKINDFSILQSYGYINILCHIFNSARNNQQQPVMFIYVMVSAGVCFGGKGRLHLIPDKTKVNAKLYVETLFPELVQNCRSVLPSGFIFQHDGAPAHTRQSWPQTEFLPTAVNSLVKMNGLRTRLTSTLWTTMSGELCLNPSREHRWSQESSVVDNGTSCHKTRATKPHWAFRKDFRFVWKMVMDTSNIH